MQLLGRNLSDVRRGQPEGRFSISTTCLIGINMLNAIEVMHENGYLHRDVKPVRIQVSGMMLCLRTIQSNFVLGLDREGSSHRSKLYIIDFGLSRRFVTNYGRVREVSSLTYQTGQSSILHLGS